MEAFWRSKVANTQAVSDDPDPHSTTGQRQELARQADRFVFAHDSQTAHLTLRSCTKPKLPNDQACKLQIPLLSYMFLNSQLQRHNLSFLGYAKRRKNQLYSHHKLQIPRKGPNDLLWAKSLIIARDTKILLLISRTSKIMAGQTHVSHSLALYFSSPM